ncbi:MAG: sigma-54 dependent transcriptional regulator [Myxococcales bacterium]
MHARSSAVLLVDDDLLHARSLARELSMRGWTVRVAGSGDEALQAIQAEPSEAIVVDLQMPGMDGLSLIERLSARNVPSALVLMSAHLDVASAVKAVRAGAQDVLEKPISAATLDQRLRAVVEGKRPAAIELPRASGSALSNLIKGEAPAIRAVREQVRTVARYRDLPVLILGETGTGKELVAQAVHSTSETDGPFVPVNCAAIPESLFESELFGHEAGSFTGARGSRPGLFESAGSGTLFLDEIGELPSSLQPKLLRALETRSFRRVGSSRDIPFRARVISATHRNLIGTASSLRSDLYYRLAGFTITTPPLRDRSEDIDMLARHFLGDFAERYGVEVDFSPRAIEALHAYAWPGNVRELRAVVQQAAVLSAGGRVGVAELMAALKDRQERPSHTALAESREPIAESKTAQVQVAQFSSPTQSGVRLEPLRDLERRTIQETWESSGHNLSAAARVLGLPRTTLRDRLRRYGLR